MVVIVVVVVFVLAFHKQSVATRVITALVLRPLRPPPFCIEHSQYCVFEHTTSGIFDFRGVWGVSVGF